MLLCLVTQLVFLKSFFPTEVFNFLNLYTSTFPSACEQQRRCGQATDVRVAMKESSMDKNSEFIINGDCSDWDSNSHSVSFSVDSNDVSAVSVNVSIQAQASGNSVTMCHKWIARKERC
jgi:hypothetical protein